MNRQQVKEVQEALERHLATMEYELNGRLKLTGSIRYDAGSIKFTVEYTEQGGEQAKFESECYYFGLKTEHYKKPFHYQGHEFYITGFNTRARKYKYIIHSDETGDTYKVSRQFIKDYTNFL